MANLFESYEDKVDSLLWGQFFELITKSQRELYERINQSTQPKVKVKAAEALTKLLLRATEFKPAV